MDMERPQPPASVASPSSSSPDAKPHANRSSVQVAVRVRPLSASEEAQASEACVQAVGTLVLLGGSGGKQFDFDAAFPPQVQQQQVYEQLVAPLIDRFFDGYNATVFAYGQTGSGKTVINAGAHISDCQRCAQNKLTMPLLQCM